MSSSSSKWGRSALRKTADSAITATTTTTATTIINDKDFPPLGGSAASIKTAPPPPPPPSPAVPIKTMAERLREQLEAEEKVRKELEEKEAYEHLQRERDNLIGNVVVGYNRTRYNYEYADEAGDAAYDARDEEMYEPHTPPYPPYDYEEDAADNESI